ncbi:MAG TPA: hypothetical protein VLC51_05835, partial [Nitrospira sp.]|nr:hypothetical protein [Nitrospira sp.]
MDTCKIGPGLSSTPRWTIARAFVSWRSIPDVALPIHCYSWNVIIEELPFPIQRIQTDRGREFFATTLEVKADDLEMHLWGWQ